MIPIKLLIWLLLLYGCENIFAGYRDCSSCILLRQCPEALNLMSNGDDSATISKLINGLCGAEVVDGKTLPKVCCSDFNDSNIETHKNFALLPEDCGIFFRKLTLDETLNQFEFPFIGLQYQIRDKNKKDLMCQGSIINNRYILTAAHCAQTIKNNIVNGVLIGGDNILSREDCETEYRSLPCKNNTQLMTLKKIVIHKDFRRQPYIVNNIALLRLQEPVDFSTKNIAPICLPIYDGLINMNIGGKLATLVGWKANVFSNIKLPIKTDEECRKYYNKSSMNNFDTINQFFCAGEEGKDTCIAIGGGPLMFEGEYNGIRRVIQFGIHSHGPTRCKTAIPDVYINVRKYVKWILDNIEE